MLTMDDLNKTVNEIIVFKKKIRQAPNKSQNDYFIHKTHIVLTKKDANE